MKTNEIIIEITEKEDGQLAKDLEHIKENKVCTVSKSRHLK